MYVFHLIDCVNCHSAVFGLELLRFWKALLARLQFVMQVVVI